MIETDIKSFDHVTAVSIVYWLAWLSGRVYIRWLIVYAADAIVPTSHLSDVLFEQGKINEQHFPVLARRLNNVCRTVVVVCWFFFEPSGVVTPTRRHRSFVYKWGNRLSGGYKSSAMMAAWLLLFYRWRGLTITHTLRRKTFSRYSTTPTLAMRQWLPVAMTTADFSSSLSIFNGIFLVRNFISIFTTLSCPSVVVTVTAKVRHA